MSTILDALRRAQKNQGAAPAKPGAVVPSEPQEGGEPEHPGRAKAARARRLPLAAVVAVAGLLAGAGAGRLLVRLAVGPSPEKREEAVKVARVSSAPRPATSRQGTGRVAETKPASPTPGAAAKAAPDGAAPKAAAEARSEPKSSSSAGQAKGAQAAAGQRKETGEEALKDGVSAPRVALAAKPEPKADRAKAGGSGTGPSPRPAEVPPAAASGGAAAPSAKSPQPVRPTGQKPAAPAPARPALKLLDAPPPDAPQVSLLFVHWTSEPARRIASVRAPGGRLVVVREGDVIPGAEAQGMHVSEIRTDGIRVEWRGKAFVIPAVR